MAHSTCHLYIFSDLKFVVALRGTASSETPHRQSDQGKRDLAVNHQWWSDGRGVSSCPLSGMPFSCMWLLGLSHLNWWRSVGECYSLNPTHPLLIAVSLLTFFRPVARIQTGLAVALWCWIKHPHIKTSTMTILPVVICTLSIVWLRPHSLRFSATALHRTGLECKPSTYAVTHFSHQFGCDVMHLFVMQSWKYLLWVQRVWLLW